MGQYFSVNARQHGFRWGNSTRTQLQSLSTCQSTDINEKVGFVNLDLSKARFIVDHSLLLLKLVEVGFDEDTSSIFNLLRTIWQIRRQMLMERFLNYGLRSCYERRP